VKKAKNRKRKRKKKKKAAGTYRRGTTSDLSWYLIFCADSFQRSGFCRGTHLGQQLG